MKKILKTLLPIVFVLALAFSCVNIAQAKTASIALLGDVDGSGFVSLEDVSVLKNTLLTGKTTSRTELGDVNGDGKVNIGDLVQLKQAEAGIPTLDASVDYDFADQVKGAAAGQIAVAGKYVYGNYQICWAKDNRALADYSALGEIVLQKNGNGSLTPHAMTAIPEGAEQIMVTDGLQFATADLPKDKMISAKKLYSFGAVSDIHMNTEKLDVALAYFKDYGIDVLACAGDISDSGASSEIEKMVNQINKALTVPFYSCMGNHDVQGVSSNLPTLGKLFDTDQPQYYTKEVNGEIFVFLGMEDWADPFVPGALDFLEDVLQKHPDERVYIFEHLFLKNTVSSIKNTYGYIIYPEGNLMTVGSEEETRFRSLLTQYKNAFHFSGHSHWVYSLQQYDPNNNIFNSNGNMATMVHISSLGSPLTSDGKTTRTNAPSSASEGMVVDVYEDFVVIKALDFEKGVVDSFACFYVDTTPKATPA